jgi:hypothetical protein
MGARAEAGINITATRMWRIKNPTATAASSAYSLGMDH